jgi:hypothetical protein
VDNNTVARRTASGTCEFDIVRFATETHRSAQKHIKEGFISVKFCVVLWRTQRLDVVNLTSPPKKMWPKALLNAVRSFKIRFRQVLFRPRGYPNGSFFAQIDPKLPKIA